MGALGVDTPLVASHPPLRPTTWRRG